MEDKAIHGLHLIYGVPFLYYRRLIIYDQGAHEPNFLINNHFLPLFDEIIFCLGISSSYVNSGTYEDVCVIFGGVVEGIGWSEFNDIWDKLYTPPFMYLGCTGLPIWTLHTGLAVASFRIKGVGANGHSKNDLHEK